MANDRQNRTPADGLLLCQARSTDGLMFSGPARSVTLPTANGEMQLRPGHAESFVVMTAGEITFEGVGQPDQRLKVGNGTLWVKDNRVTILV